MTFITLPYSYRVEGVLAREHKVKHHRVLDTIVVDVPELSDAEVPPAFEFGRQGDTVRESYRAHEGRPVQPMQSPGLKDFRQPLEPMRASDMDAASTRIMLQEQPVFWATYPLPMPTHDHFGEVSRRAPLHESVKFKSIVRSHMEKDRAAAEAFGAGMVLVDGVLHCRVPEPRWVVSGTEGDSNIRVWMSSSKHPSGEVFRIDRRLDAIAFAEMLVARGSRVVVDVVHEDSGLIEWVHDDAHESAVSAAGSVMHALAGARSSQVRFLDHSFFAPMCELRRMWREGAARTEIVLELESLESALDRCTDPWCHELVGVLRSSIEAPLLRHRDIEPALVQAATDLDAFSMEPR